MDELTRCLVLAIETSCDETSASVVLNGRTVLSNIIYSQVPIHKKFGGVVPEIASRKHIEQVLPVVNEAITQAGIVLDDIDVIGVTYGPGLVGALLVGVSVAKALSFALGRPLIGVNHLEGHIFANFLSHKDLTPPFIALVVSGGHTSLVYVEDYNSFKLLGQTRDDAAGEAFDKVARVMGLPYPGGPLVDELAKKGDASAIHFPRALTQGGYDFSFSGLKSAVINYLHNAEQKSIEVNYADVAASFQVAVVDVLVSKTIQAAQELAANKIVLAGGVAANSLLRALLAKAVEEDGRKLYYPQMVFCSDNAAMIASRAFYQYQAGNLANLQLNAVPSLQFSKINSCGCG